MISLTAGYSYPVFAVGLVLSIAALYGLMRLVDSMVNRLRNIVRGGALERVGSQAPRLA